jgi:hypothetical protein
MAKKKGTFTLADLDKYRNRQGLLHVKATNPHEAPLWVPVNILLTPAWPMCGGLPTEARFSRVGPNPDDHWPCRHQ